MLIGSQATYRAALRCRGTTRQLILVRRGYASSTTPTPEIYDVVVVGGGPAGLSLLSGLRAIEATSRLKVALIESQDLFKSTFDNSSSTSYSNRCSSLTPASVAYFRKIGAWQHFDTTRIQPYQEMQVWDGVPGSRISFDWASTRTISTIAYMTENANITSSLLKHLHSLGSLTTFSPARVTDITLGPQTPSLDLTSWPILTLSTGDTLAARLLVGADGFNSPVRTFAGIQSRGWDYARHGLVATLQLEGPGWGAEAHKIAYQRFLPTGPVALLPLPGNMATMVWSTTPERAAMLKTLSKSDFVAMANAAFRLSPVDLTYLHTMESGHVEEVAWREPNTPLENERALPMRITGVQDGSVASFPLRMRHADTYTGERVALVGDAAHTVHPLAGQGLNQGQGDVAALVETIEEAVKAGQDIGAGLSLESYGAKRYAENHVLMGVVDKLHKLYSVESGPLVGLRSLGLGAVDALGPVKEFFMRRAAGR